MIDNSSSHTEKELLAIVRGPSTLTKTSSGKLQRSLCKEAYLQGKLTKRGLPVGLQIAKLSIKGSWIKLGLALKKCLQFIYSLYIGILLVFFTPCILFLTFPPRQLALKSCKMLARMLLSASFKASIVPNATQ